VGDAAGLVRAFKGKGVTSAMQTGMRAAQVILQDGISARAFGNYLDANREIIEDLPYGQIMRRFTILAARVGLMNVVLLAAQRDATLRQALFDAVSAHRPYGQVFRDALSPASVRSVVSALARAVVSRPV
jgi:flavin-dependent dehydrogenase